MSRMNDTETRIILDNGGGITLQLNGWAHYYDSEKQAATDIKAFLLGSDTHGWDGHDEDALACDPTDDQIRKGGYRIIEIGEHDDLKTLAGALEGCGWGNGESLAGHLLVVAE